MREDAQDVSTNDVIVLNKWMVITAGVAVLIFLAGGLAGYFLAKYAFDYSLEQTAGQLAIQQQPSAPQVQPTDVPTRIDDVKTDGDPQLGPDNAKVTIVEFSDFQCPYCKRFRDTTFDALIEKYGDDIRIIYRDYPLPFHPQAQIAAEAAECANEQGKYWEMHDIIYANQETLSDDAYSEFSEQLDLDTQKFDECLSSNKYADEIAADQKDGESYGVTGTPTFFINGWILVGAQPTSEFEKLIDQELGG
jgi:protein-disulfide isomerase